jgi:hypothetical protein
MKLPIVVVAVLVISAGAYFAFDRFSSRGDSAVVVGTDAVANQAAQGFGTPVALDATAEAVPGSEKLRGSLFPVGCESEQGSATGVAYVVAVNGLLRGESTAFASSVALQVCMESRVAYLHDGLSALKVSIVAYDPDAKMVRLAIAAPLPAQAMRLVEQAGPSYVATISGGAQSLVQESPGLKLAPGAPIIDPEGYAIGIIGSNGARVMSGTLCNSLLAC